VLVSGPARKRYPGNTERSILRPLPYIGLLRVGRPSRVAIACDGRHTALKAGAADSSATEDSHAHPGHEVLEAADGAAGLRLYRERGADVVILDIFMPERDGLEFIRELRAEGRPAKIVAISGGGQTGQFDMLKAAAAFGAARTLSKPVALSGLVATVHDLLREGPQS
jgi:two-component system chemotaxis response regulator CheY